MDKRKGLPTPGAGLGGKFVSLLIILLLFSSCAPPDKSAEELRGEIQELKKEVKAMQEKLDKMQAGQETLMDLVKQSATPPPAAVLAPPPQFQAPLPPQFQAPAGPQFQAPAAPQPGPTLTVSQLLKSKDQYLGARVTVKGEAGPVLVHHKSLLLKSPEGMVEVLFGKLPDEKQVQRLTSTSIERPVTVTGVVGLPPRTGAAKLQINAESVDF